MDRYVVIGNPVLHSLSPAIHARFAEQTRERLEYSTLQVPVGEFAAHARRFFEDGGRGANVTLPFKADAFAFAFHPSERARLAGAANFLAARDGAIQADNTDGAGLVMDLRDNLGVRLEGARVLLVGAGGAARGVVKPMLDAGVASIVIANRTNARARELAERFAPFGAVGASSLADLQPGFDVVVNATSTSVHGEPLVLPPGVIHGGNLAYDMAYGPAARGFLESARATGARASDGLGMLVEQAAESFALWRGKRPETAAILAELRGREVP